VKLHAKQDENEEQNKEMRLGEKSNNETPIPNAVPAMSSYSIRHPWYRWLSEERFWRV
jgi:hypothetical protein